MSGRAGDINNLTSIPYYFDEPYRDLGVCVKKAPSAWTAVWTGACPPTALITAPQGRDLDDF